MTPDAFDPAKFDHPLQVGGIRTARYDWPDAGGAPGCRVALFETGTPLRFVVNLDRGGDIVEAWYGGAALAYLTPNGYTPPGTGEGNVDRWTHGWNGGLVSTCGPRAIGRRRNIRGEVVELHGAYHHRPAAVVALRNPDLRRGDRTMALELVTRDTQLFGPVLEMRRTISATLGEPGLRLHDTVTNLGNTAVEHHWLYHCNLGYPLLDDGAELVYAGRRDRVWPSGEGGVGDDADLAAWKRVSGPLPQHAGEGERVVVMEPTPGRGGEATAALLNAARGLGVSIRFDPAQLPRLANWQHFGPAGSYVTGLEPFNGSLFGLDQDDHPRARVMLEPGASLNYALQLEAHAGADALAALRKHDGPVA